MKNKKLYAYLYNIIIIAIIMLEKIIPNSQVIFSHLIYIPIIIGSFLFGPIYGSLYGILAGLSIGFLYTNPLYLNRSIDLIVRTISYVLIGILSGSYKTVINYYNNKCRVLASKNVVTNINNMSYLKLNDLSGYIKDVYLVTILIHNFEKIIRYFGQNFYNNFLIEFYKLLDSNVNLDKVILVNNSNIFYMLVNNTDSKMLDNILINTFKKELIVNNIPLYYECSIGYEFRDKIDFKVEENIFFNSSLMAYKSYANNDESNIYDKTYKKVYEYNLLNDFKTSLNNNDVYVMAQPIIRNMKSDVIYLEFLSRWNHPLKGEIMPFNFIPMLEDTKLINDLTMFVLKEALECITKYDNYDLRISVNISVNNLTSDKLINKIINLIKSYNVLPYKIEFEITENLLLDLKVNVVRNIRLLKEFGVNITIDDFGKGFSSLSYLSEIQIDYFKLDKSFIDKIGSDKASEEIIKYTINLANNLNLEMVAEGVETKEQDLFLRSNGCHFMQGYYYSKPFKKSEILDWIENKKKMFD